MNIKNFLTLTVRSEEFNLVANKPLLLKQLRKLTLEPYSGMNYELNHLEKTALNRKVYCKVLTAFRDKKLVGWALLSKEPSQYTFINSDGYHPGMGSLFQVFVHPDYRKQGIASELIKVARKKAHGSRLCVCPWDFASIKFFQRFDNYKTKQL